MTALVYWPVGQSEFVAYDDYSYILRNPNVRSGLSWSNIHWAFTSFYASNWHPLTWISHAIDCQIFGIKASGPHITNLILHIANSLLLFSFLKRLTGELWRAAVVASLFAIHPMHVESVAWIAERKDVLSAFFFMLALIAYTIYTTNPAKDSGLVCKRRIAFYILCLLFFLCGIMSKPMLVSFPFLLLLLDFWPLRRILGAAGSDPAKNVLLEKLPFLAISVVSAIVTILAQRAGGAITTLEEVDLPSRVSNAVVSYIWYLTGLFWPSHMSVIYPYRVWPISYFVGAGLAFLIITLFAIRERRRRPYILFGLLWFVVSLVPVIGLLKVGAQAFADRYTYLPSIGVIIATVWWIGDVVASINWPLLWVKVRISKSNLVGFWSCFLLLGYGFTAHHQVRYWRNSETLFQHALAVTKDNFKAEVNLAFYYSEQGQALKAEEHYRSAVRTNPRFATAWNGLGCALAEENKHEEAIGCYQTALQLNPSMLDAKNNLGNSLCSVQKTNEAVECYQSVLRVTPHHALANFNLGIVLLGRNQVPEAIEHLHTSLQSDPFCADAHVSYARALSKRGDLAQAAAEYRSALEINPRLTAAQYGLGELLMDQGQRELACDKFLQVTNQQPEHIVEALNNLAWLLATHWNPASRDGIRAVEFAESACELTDYKEAIIVGTLAAAYAEAGRFDEAISAGEKAASIAKETNQLDLVAKNAKLLAQYRTHEPYHEQR